MKEADHNNQTTNAFLQSWDLSVSSLSCISFVCQAQERYVLRKQAVRESSNFGRYKHKDRFSSLWVRVYIFWNMKFYEIEDVVVIPLGRHSRDRNKTLNVLHSWCTGSLQRAIFPYKLRTYQCEWVAQRDLIQCFRGRRRFGTGRHVCVRVCVVYVVSAYFPCVTCATTP